MRECSHSLFFSPHYPYRNGGTCYIELPHTPSAPRRLRNLGGLLADHAMLLSYSTIATRLRSRSLLSCMRGCQAWVDKHAIVGRLMDRCHLGPLSRRGLHTEINQVSHDLGRTNPSTSFNSDTWRATTQMPPAFLNSARSIFS